MQENGTMNWLAQIRQMKNSMNCSRMQWNTDYHKRKG